MQKMLPHYYGQKKAVDSVTHSCYNNVLAEFRVWPLTALRQETTQIDIN